MKIAFILPSFSGNFLEPNGGVESAIVNLISGIHNVNNNIMIFLLFPNNKQVISNLPSGVIPIPVTSRFRSVWTYNYPLIGISKNVEKEIQKINPDVVHVQGAPGFYRSFDKEKVYITIHGIPYIDSSFRKGIASQLKSFLTKLIFINDIKRYGNFIFLVNYAYSLFHKYLDGETNAILIPNPIQVKPDTKILELNKIPVLFFSGILRPLKNIEALIIASHLLKLEGRQFILKIAGRFSSVNYEQKIKDLIKDYNLTNEVYFLGQLSSKDISNVLKSIDINLLPSFQEVCPMSIIEAMAMGKPSIATAVGGIPEIIINNYNGFLIPIGDSKALANKIREIMDNPSLYASLAKHSFEIAELFSIKNIAKQTLNFYGATQ